MSISRAGIIIQSVVGLLIVLVVSLRPALAQPASSDPEHREIAAETVRDPNESQTPDVADTTRTSEWIIGVGVASSVELFHSRSGIRYGVQTVSWARELSRNRGPVLVRGRVAWVVEVTPALFESSPTRVYGFGVAPIGLRWNLVPNRRWSAFTELAGGVLASSAAIPDGVARFNFTAHLGAGARVDVLRDHSLVIAYRLQHLSNGNRLPENPGVNSHVAFVGWSLKRR